MTSRLQQQLAAFRAQEAKASKTKDDLGKERERKRAERKANVVQAKPKPATVAPAPVRRAARKVPLAKLVKDVLDCVQEVILPPACHTALCSPFSGLASLC